MMMAAPPKSAEVEDSMGLQHIGFPEQVRWIFADVQNTHCIIAEGSISTSFVCT